MVALSMPVISSIVQAVDDDILKNVSRSVGGTVIAHDNLTSVTRV